MATAPLFPLSSPARAPTLGFQLSSSGLLWVETHVSLPSEQGISWLHGSLCCSQERQMPQAHPLARGSRIRPSSHLLPVQVSCGGVPGSTLNTEHGCCWGLQQSGLWAPWQGQHPPQSHLPTWYILCTPLRLLYAPTPPSPARPNPRHQGRLPEPLLYTVQSTPCRIHRSFTKELQPPLAGRQQLAPAASLWVGLTESKDYVSARAQPRHKLSTACGYKFIPASAQNKQPMGPK